ncbi:hypothetical protein GGI42DRAFT_329986 [Trichoderma sp. SZMC 28013]
MPVPQLPGCMQRQPGFRSNRDSTAANDVVDGRSSAAAAKCFSCVSVFVFDTRQGQGQGAVRHVLGLSHAEWPSPVDILVDLSRGDKRIQAFFHTPPPSQHRRYELSLVPCPPEQTGEQMRGEGINIIVTNAVRPLINSISPPLPNASPASGKQCVICNIYTEQMASKMLIRRLINSRHTASIAPTCRHFDGFVFITSHPSP